MKKIALFLMVVIALNACTTKPKDLTVSEEWTVINKYCPSILAERKDGEKRIFTFDGLRCYKAEPGWLIEVSKGHNRIFPPTPVKKSPTKKIANACKPTGSTAKK
jgi:hypothetical protein